MFMSIRLFTFALFKTIHQGSILMKIKKLAVITLTFLILLSSFYPALAAEITLDEVTVEVLKSESNPVNGQLNENGNKEITTPTEEALIPAEETVSEQSQVAPTPESSSAPSSETTTSSTSSSQESQARSIAANSTIK